MTSGDYDFLVISEGSGEEVAVSTIVTAAAPWTGIDSDQSVTGAAVPDYHCCGAGQMETEPQIRFRGMEPSPSVEGVVRERIGRLARFHDRIISCVVVIEAPHRHDRQDQLYRVQVDVTVPGTTIVTGRAGRNDHAHEDVYVAIRDSSEREDAQGSYAAV